MDLNRLFRMLFRMALREGTKRLNAGQRADPRAAQVQKSLKTFNRMKRLWRS